MSKLILELHRKLTKLNKARTYLSLSSKKLDELKCKFPEVDKVRSVLKEVLYENIYTNPKEVYSNLLNVWEKVEGSFMKIDGTILTYEHVRRDKKTFKEVKELLFKAQKLVKELSQTNEDLLENVDEEELQRDSKRLKEKGSKT